ncbi:Protein Bhlhb9 [Manis pentadactyla]|nr:Protein Bhlhb9 [Manis pentadactyla]
MQLMIETGVSLLYSLSQGTDCQDPLKLSLVWASDLNSSSFVIHLEYILLCLIILFDYSNMKPRPSWAYMSSAMQEVTCYTSNPWAGPLNNFCSSALFFFSIEFLTSHPEDLGTSLKVPPALNTTSWETCTLTIGTDVWFSKFQE